ncbi:MAG TPA: SRPBCC family protein [Stackebrandtia sp.]|jgi:hypothetical protein|uniref:SRPBCC family protein n=1 Tax=Stackebrandtia sp. TaxID=2023065 RepID=UPI002D45D27D|nr:SRPBCC family protein [Stackebrandtia sp.]HZE41859.1 SRPBCC family protein [Stackebrandtia sp.]
MTITDAVTGAKTEISMTVDLSPGECWELVTDVSRAAEASPECVAAAWLDVERPGPRIGARFMGRNEYGNGFTAEVVCVVTEAQEPRRFAWAVLDDSEQLERAHSIWRYELVPVGERRTEIRQSFEHGSGNSGAREGERENPGVLGRRLEQLRRNMSETLAALVGGKAEEVAR